MTHLKPIVLVIGILLATLGCTMMIPALYELNIGNQDWIVFAASSAVTLFTGIILALSNRGPTEALNIRQAFLLTALSWVALTAFAALPFVWSSINASYTDAFFEAMSGITTTGSTVFSGLDKAPPGILLWRSILQWMGGIGIIVMAIAVLPMLSVGGMQLFRTESSDTSEKILPRASQIAGSISLIYLSLTLLCALAYSSAGMPLFDAVNHAMTTISTGGFSTHDVSLGHFDNADIEMVAIVFMILGSLPFTLYLHLFNRQYQSFFRDTQARWFIATAAIFIFLGWIAQATSGLEPGILELRDAAFSVVSVMTTTGFATVDYSKWSIFASTLFFFVTFVGGCTGSTAGGIKIFRFQVLFETLKIRTRTLLHPNGIFIPKYNRKAIPESAISSVMSFLFLYLVCFLMIAIVLGFYHLDPLTAMSASATALANVGPGLGSVVGPSGNFASLPDGAKWVLSLGMLLGRLELFTVLLLLMPSFWKY